MLDTTNLTINVDFDSMTIGEMIDIEDLAGVPIGDLGDGKALSAKAMLAFVYVTVRRDHPDATIDDIKALDISILNTITPDEDAGGGEKKGAAGSKNTNKPG